MPLNKPRVDRDRAAALGDALRARGWMCATAESCTGGLVAGAITAIAGSSEWFERGFVTYSNEAKVAMLSVPPETLEAHGAVSEPTAQAMAVGALAQSRADVAVSITGIAGPGGAVPGKPVGTVCFAWASRDGAVRVETRQLPGDRTDVRRASVVIALDGLIDLAQSA
jgi:nicotinamide-nucleotide amidase